MTIDSKFIIKYWTVELFLQHFLLYIFSNLQGVFFLTKLSNYHLTFSRGLANRKTTLARGSFQKWGYIFFNFR